MVEVVKRACEPSQRLTRHAPRGHVRESSLHDRPRMLESAEKFQKRLSGCVNRYAFQESKIYICESFVQASAVSGCTPNDMEAPKFDWLIRVVTTNCGLEVRGQDGLSWSSTSSACQTRYRRRCSVHACALRSFRPAVTSIGNLNNRPRGFPGRKG